MGAGTGVLFVYLPNKKIFFSDIKAGSPPDKLKGLFNEFKGFYRQRDVITEFNGGHFFAAEAEDFLTILFNPGVVSGLIIDFHAEKY